MKNPTLRILISAILFSLISGIVVSIISLMLGWKISTKFSDGFFWAGAIVISIGFVNILGMFSQPTDSRMQDSQSAVHLDTAERYKILEADILHGYHHLAFLGTSGSLLFGLAGLAILVGRLFKPATGYELLFQPPTSAAGSRHVRASRLMKVSAISCLSRSKRIEHLT